MTNEELLLAMSDMMDAKLKPVHVKIDRMDRRLGKVEKRLEKLEVQEHSKKLQAI